MIAVFLAVAAVVAMLVLLCLSKVSGRVSEDERKTLVERDHTDAY